MYGIGIIRYLQETSRMLFLPELGASSDGPGYKIKEQSKSFGNKEAVKQRKI